MSLESVMEEKFAALGKAFMALRETVKDAEKKVRELPNEIAALQKKRQAADEELKMTLAQAEKKVLGVYVAAQETERRAQGIQEKMGAERKELEIEKSKMVVLQKSLDQQKAVCDKLLKDVEAKQAQLDGKLAKLETLKNL